LQNASTTNQDKEEHIMSIITISKGSYTHGAKLAERIADKLGFDCISREILLKASKEFNISEIKLNRAIEDAPSFLDRYTFGRENYIAYIRTAILDHLVKDNIVYHGFAGQFFVQDIPHVLKVRVVADMDERIMYMMEREKVSTEEALRIVEKVDKERKDWSMKLYGIDTWDCRLYDMTINIGKITLDNAVDMICQTVKLKAFHTTAKSQLQIEKIASESRLELENVVSPFFEPIRESPWSKEIKKKNNRG
jgi:cytidylate kinase